MVGGVFHLVENPQPLEKPLLHGGGAERQTLAQVVVEQHAATGEKPAGEERLQRNKFRLVAQGHREELEDVAVQQQEAVRATVPKPRQIGSPGRKRGSGGDGGEDGGHGGRKIRNQNDE